MNNDKLRKLTIKCLEGEMDYKQKFIQRLMQNLQENEKKMYQQYNLYFVNL